MLRRYRKTTTIMVSLLALSGAAVLASSATATPTSRLAPARAEGLTPAQECGISAGQRVLSSTTKPASATVAGWAFVGNALAIDGAAVRLRAPNGRLIPLLDRRSATTGQEGTFLVSARALPHRFTVEVSGGRVAGERFRGTLRAAVRHYSPERVATVYVSPASSLVDAYLATHPARSVGTASAVVKTFLRVPPNLTLTFDLRNSPVLFDGVRFLAEARGHVNRFLGRLAHELKLAKRHAFRGEAAPRGITATSIFKLVGTELGKGAISHVGGLGMGWVLSQFGIDDGVSSRIQGISNQLDQVSQQLTELGTRLNALRLDVAELKLGQTQLPLIALRNEVSSYMADLANLAAMSKQPDLDRRKLKARACTVLANLKDLANGRSASGGYGEVAVEKAFFPAGAGSPLTDVATDVVSKKYDHWWTAAAREEIETLVTYWIGVQASWLTLKLEWEHAVNPCAPTETAVTCEALRWSSNFLSDSDAELATLPPALPEGTWIQRGSSDAKGLMWAPTSVPAQTFAHPPPAEFFQTFWQLAPDGLVDPRDCSDYEVTICAIEGVGRTGDGWGSFTDWRPPSVDEARALVEGWKNGFASPAAYLAAAAPLQPGASAAWLAQGGNRIWTSTCKHTIEESDPLVRPQVTEIWDSRRLFDLSNGTDSWAAVRGDRNDHQKAGFLLVRETDGRYWTARSKSPTTRYVGETYPSPGADALNGQTNDCTAYTTPCRTLAHVLEVADRGDVIRLAGGTYAGGVFVPDNVTLRGNGANMTVISGSGATRPVITTYAPSTRIEGVSLRNGKVGLEVDDGSAAVVDSTISGNSNETCSAVSTTGGTTTLLRTAVSGNHLTQTNPFHQVICVSQRGGVKSTLRLINSTVAENSGGVEVWPTGALILINSSIVHNRLDTFRWGRGLDVQSGGSAMMANTLIGDNGDGYDDCFGAASALPGGHNIIQSSYCTFSENGSTGNRIGPGGHPFDAIVERVAGPLGMNGGLTPTAPLLAGSRAIGTGDPSTCADSATVAGVDQRGLQRPTGSCDIGAYDSKAVPPTTAG